jgi:hypothetical protein
LQVLPCDLPCDLACVVFDGINLGVLRKHGARVWSFGPFAADGGRQDQVHGFVVGDVAKFAVVQAVRLDAVGVRANLAGFPFDRVRVPVFGTVSDGDFFGVRGFGRVQRVVRGAVMKALVDFGGVAAEHLEDVEFWWPVRGAWCVGGAVRVERPEVWFDPLACGQQCSHVNASVFKVEFVAGVDVCRGEVASAEFFVVRFDDQVSTADRGILSAEVWQFSVDGAWTFDD